MPRASQKTKSVKKNKKIAIHKRIHNHLKKKLVALKKKHRHTHKVVVVMSFTIPLILGFVFFGSGALYFFENYQDKIFPKEEISVSLPVVKDDTVNWAGYTDSLTGFTVKYPDFWHNSVIDGSKDNVNFLRKVTFDNGLNQEDKRFKGFAVSIYEAKKYSGPVGTDELKDNGNLTQKDTSCQKTEYMEASLGEKSYPVQEVNIIANDPCFQKVFFYSLTRGKYTYNIYPLINTESQSLLDLGLKIETINNFPKFFEILSTFVFPEEVIKAEPEKKVEPKPVQNIAPRRVLIRKATCPNKNDHPRKSRTKKHRHMDEDCCMDPDEWPNPRCQY